MKKGGAGKISQHARRAGPTPTVPTVPSATAARRWLVPALIVLATLACYLPAILAGYIWDDKDYVLNNLTLRSPAGLFEIWFKLGATPQYYPLVFSTFWLEYQIWGLAPLGYHLVNVLLHAGSAVLFAAALGRLRVRGAWLAGLLFALHPVGVESVAWITERKNVLSTLFYLLSLLALLRFYGLDRPPGSPAALRRSWLPWWLALACFGCALFSKTVTCSLPLAMAIILWWKRGRPRLPDLYPLVPFFILGGAMGLVTAWMEKHVVGAQGAEWTFSPLEHLILAGRIICFYLGKLLWPAGLTFIYPRWRIDAASAGQYLFPLGVAALLAVLGLGRRRFGRGPLAALLFFVVTLFPALGFIGVYPMRFSFVADHFQYLAMLGPLALAGAAGAAAIGRLAPQRHEAGLACLAALLAAVLGPLTWLQAGNYKDLKTLWRANLARNPDSFLALNNLGYLLDQEGQSDQAKELFERALRANPRYPDAHLNLANQLHARGRDEEALAHYAEARRLSPGNPLVPFNVGQLWIKRGDYAKAVAEFRKAVELKPEFMDGHFNLAGALVCLRQYDEALDHYYLAIALAQGTHPEYFDTLAIVYGEAGRFEEAVKAARQAILAAQGARNEPLARTAAAHLQILQSRRSVSSTLN